MDTQERKEGVEMLPTARDVDAAKKQGYREGVEKAAKVAELHECKCKDDFGHSMDCGVTEYVADAIRALLDCETCGGTKKVDSGGQDQYGNWIEDHCPDCKEQDDEEG